VKAGDVFRLVGVAEKHAKIIVSDPVNYPDKLYWVGMTSFDKLEDQTCILNVGDHSTGTTRTCIVYSRQKTASAKELEFLNTKNRLTLYEPVSSELLELIRKGAMASIRAPKDLKSALLQQGLVPAS